MKNALNNEVGMLGGMFLWLVANLKQGVFHFIKQALPPNISAGSVHAAGINSLETTYILFELPFKPAVKASLVPRTQ